MLDRRFMETEGFQRFVGERTADPGEALRANTHILATESHPGDARGGYRAPRSGAHRVIEWETQPAQEPRETTFVWAGGSQVFPEYTPAFPYATALLTVDGGASVHIPIGRPEGFTVEGDGLRLSFQPQRFEPLIGEWHRSFSPSGTSGLYRLTVPAHLVQQGRPLRLRLEVVPKAGVESTVYVMPRTDCLRSDVDTLRAEVGRLQEQLVMALKVVETLAAQANSDLFPERVQGEPVLITQDPVRHLHPATISVMADDEVVVTTREAIDHLARDGRMMLVRSRDGGRTWGDRELMFDLGHVDHRNSPILELANGDWICTDYRPGMPGGIYNADGAYISHGDVPSLWAAWSTDRGRTWTHGAQPLVVPGSRRQLVEVERQAIQLPSGRVLVAGNFYERDDSAGGIAVFASDDHGRSYVHHATLPFDMRVEGEPTLVRCRSGKIVLLVRTQCGYHASKAHRPTDWRATGDLLQSDSTDDGRTWTAFRRTGMSSMNAPGHLLQLKDGRLLCSHASRTYPGSIYLTTSADEGRTWNTASTKVVASNLVNFDFSYPTTGQLRDGTLITVWYGNLFGKFFIRGVRHRPERL